MLYTITNKPDSIFFSYSSGDRRVLRWLEHDLKWEQKCKQKKVHWACGPTACVMDVNPSPMLGVLSPSNDAVPLGTSSSIAWVIT